MNMTHTGELGYVFYIPTEFALHVYDELVEAGKVGWLIFSDIIFRTVIFRT
jgi:glycine cleavage system aminomethyltransferase T